MFGGSVGVEGLFGGGRWQYGNGRVLWIGGGGPYSCGLARWCTVVDGERSGRGGVTYHRHSQKVGGCVSPMTAQHYETPLAMNPRPHLPSPSLTFPHLPSPSSSPPCPSQSPRRQKNYAEAQKIKRIADVMEERERKSIDTDNRKIFARKEVRVDKMHPLHIQIRTYTAHTNHTHVHRYHHAAFDIKARLCYRASIPARAPLCRDRPPAVAACNTVAAGYCIYTVHEPGTLILFISLPNIRQHLHPPHYAHDSGMTMDCCRLNCASSSRRSSRHF